MSKDMLGSVVRAAIGVPQERLDLLAKIASTFAGDNPDGEAQHSRFAELYRQGLPKRELKKPTRLLSAIATTNLGIVEAKPTEKCFTGSRWVHRDSDFDSWLPASQPNADACSMATLTPSRDWTFAEAAAAVLGIGAGTSIALLGSLLIEHGHTMTLAQAEEMVEATERGEKTGMRTDGYWNFFFVETGDPKNPVSVGNVNRGGRAWSAGVDRLGDDRRWRADRRLLVRNLDASKLGA